MTVYLSTDGTMLGAMLGDYSVGIYSVSSKAYFYAKAVINTFPMTVIPSFSLNLIQNTKPAFSGLSADVFRFSFFVTYPIATGLICVSGSYFYLMSGVSEPHGVLVLIILCIAMIFAVSSIIIVNAIFVNTKQEKVIFRATPASAITNIVLDFVLISTLGIVGVAIVTLFSEAIVMIISCNAYKNLNPISAKDVLSLIARCAAIGVICLVVSKLNLSFDTDLVVKIFASLLGYTLTVFCMNRSMIKTFVSKDF